MAHNPNETPAEHIRNALAILESCSERWRSNSTVLAPGGHGHVAIEHVDWKAALDRLRTAVAQLERSIPGRLGPNV